MIRPRLPAIKVPFVAIRSKLRAAHPVRARGCYTKAPTGGKAGGSGPSWVGATPPPPPPAGGGEDPRPSVPPPLAGGGQVEGAFGRRHSAFGVSHPACRARRSRRSWS